MSNISNITTGQLDSATLAERSIEPMVNKLDANKTPLIVILTLGEGRKEEAGHYKVEWFEDAPLSRHDSLGAALTAAAVTMTVADYTKFVKNMLVRIESTGEIVRVTATPTTSLVSITRAVGETAAAAAAQGAKLRYVSMAYEEGAAKGTALMSLPSEQYNYMQIFRNLVKWTGSAAATKVVVKNKTKDEERADQILEHFKDMEQAALLGERYYTASGAVDSGRLSTMRGVLRFIQTNVTDFGGEVTEDEWEEFVRINARYSGPVSVGIFSSKLVSILNGFGREKLRVIDPKDRYGLSLSSYVHGGKQVDFMAHPLMENSTQTDLTGLAGTGVILDPSDLKMRYLPGRYMIHRYNADNNLNDFSEEEILSECCVSLEQEKKHSEATGAQS